MPMIYQFRALSGENDRFVRDYQLMYDSTLLDFHRFVCGDLGFDPDSMASFFLAGRGWEKLGEFTLFDMGGGADGETPQTMERVTLHQLIDDNGDRLIYTFDIFGDRSLFMEMTGVYRSDDGAGYPRTLHSAGDAPAQFDASQADAGDPIFDDVMDGFDEFDEFDGGDIYGDGY